MLKFLKDYVTGRLMQEAINSKNDTQARPHRRHDSGFEGQNGKSKPVYHCHV